MIQGNDHSGWWYTYQPSPQLGWFSIPIFCLESQVTMVPKHQSAQGLVFRSGHGFCSSIHWGAAEGISSPAEVSIGSLFGTGKSWKSTRNEPCGETPLFIWKSISLSLNLHNLAKKRTYCSEILKFKIYIHRIEQGLNIAWRMYIYIYDKEKQCLSNYTSFRQRGGTSPNFVHAPQMRTHPINGDQWISAHSHNHGSKSFRYFQQVAI